jgi:hypothetical protein
MQICYWEMYLHDRRLCLGNLDLRSGEVRCVEDGDGRWGWGMGGCCLGELDGDVRG